MKQIVETLLQQNCNSILWPKMKQIQGQLDAKNMPDTTIKTTGGKYNTNSLTEKRIKNIKDMEKNVLPQIIRITYLFARIFLYHKSCVLEHEQRLNLKQN